MAPLGLGCATQGGNANAAQQESDAGAPSEAGADGEAKPEALPTVEVTPTAEAQPEPPSEPAAPTLKETKDSRAASRLAGLLGSPAAGASADESAWTEKKAARHLRYTASVEAKWAAWEKKIGGPMAKWGPEHLPQGGEDTVFYPFSGPDFSTVHRLYPQAKRYVLVAMQKAGPPLHLSGLRDHAADDALDLLSLVFANFTQKGFFITQRMNARFGADQPVKGLTPILMAFAAREGFLVESVEPIWIADSGKVELDPGDPQKLRTWDSVRLNLRDRSSGRAVQLDYVRFNLADRRIKDRPSHMTWLDAMAHQRVFVKAASHLMQQTNFRIVRTALLDHPRSILQDESGLPFTKMRKAYDVHLFGDFTKVNTLFKEGAQLSLAEAYAREETAPLPFEIGYKKRSGSCLQLGLRGESPPWTGGAEQGAKSAPSPSGGVMDAQRDGPVRDVSPPSGL